MPRGRKPRTWVRLDCEGILRGSINYLFLENDYNMTKNEGIIKILISLACQGIWTKMIAFSEVCGGRSGFIEDNNQRGLPHQYIAQELHCPLDLFELVLSKMSEDGAIRLNGTGSIELINFKHYQFSEYDRQKIYRQKEGQGKQTFEEFVEVMRQEYSDLDIDEELKKCRLWWSEGKKELKRPKSAFKNWLIKAREMRKNNDGRFGTNKPQRLQPRKPEEYTDPEEYRKQSGW